MNSVLSFLNGKKTYIVVLLGLVVIGASMLGVIDTETANSALVALGLGGAVTLRAAIAKAQAAAEQATQAVQGSSGTKQG